MMSGGEFPRKTKVARMSEIICDDSRKESEGFSSVCSY